MKNLTLSVALLLALSSCKTESKDNQTVTPLKTEAAAVEMNAQDEIITPVSPFLNPDAIVPPGFFKTGNTYEGVGVFSADGEMNYNILMPLLRSGSYSFVQFYNIGDNVLFMQMQDPDFEPLTKNAIYTLREDISSLRFDYDKDISVFLYFENGTPLSKTEAIRVYAKGCTSMTEPKKCGTGILKFADK